MQYFNIVTRLCVIDPATGFRSVYALNVSGNSPSWTTNQQFNTYPSSTNAHADLIWGDGTVDSFDFSGSFTRVHDYSSGYYHDVNIVITWATGSAGFGGRMTGNVGNIIIHLESTPP